ncbi:MAG: CHAD domain-containing protein [Planctomycetota bacterium]|nr:MAG: CHAD domain-containing protein [Planctomycetota bacterium]
MGRNSKWIESDPDDSVEEVARRALESRLERLWYYVQTAVAEPPSETENVHQLRVFARRTAAAMENFSDWLPRRRGHWMRKQLKRLRKAAGEARDLDVLRIRWTETLASLPAPQSALLLEQVKRRRRKAQWPVEDIYHKLAGKDFEKRARKFVKRIRLRNGDEACDQKLACLARKALGGLVIPYLQAAGSEMNDAESLHAFRIRSKQVRYAMELFAGAFDEDFRRALYPIVADLQDKLGEINDHVTAQNYLTAWREQTDAPAVLNAIDAGLAHEQQAFAASRDRFLAWWTPERRQDLHSRFARYVDLETAPQASEECA